MPTYSIIKLMKIKNREKKESNQSKKHFYRGTPMQMTADFSSEITKAKKREHFQSAERQNYQPKSL